MIVIMISLVGDPACGRETFVVGTEYHKGLKSVTTKTTTATLIREPRNPHDANAIAVWANGKQVGYIAAVNAARYASAMDRAGGQVLVGCVVREESIGRVLNVLLPDSEVADRVVWERLRHSTRGPRPPVRTGVTLSRLGDYQDLLPERQGDAKRGYLAPTATPSGKYAGQTRLECVVDGAVIGLVPATKRDTYAEVFEAAEAGPGVWCEVMIRAYDRWWAKAFVMV